MQRSWIGERHTSLPTYSVTHAIDVFPSENDGENILLYERLHSDGN